VPRPLRTLIRCLFCLAFLLSAPALGAAQAGDAAKPALGHDDYDTWRSIEDTTLSRDGRWLVYALVPQEGDGELVVRHLESGRESRQPRGRRPVITADGRFVAYAVVPRQLERRKPRRAGDAEARAVESGLGVLDLDSGRAWTTERVKSFRLPERGGAHLAYLREATEHASGPRQAGAKRDDRSGEGERRLRTREPATDLVIRDLASGGEAVVREVSEYRWAPDGTWLAYAVAGRLPARDGVFVRQLPSGTTVAAVSGPGRYVSLTIDGDGRQLAFVGERGDGATARSASHLYHWSPGTGLATELVTPSTKGMPAGFGVSEHASLEFSRDGARLFLGTGPLAVDAGDDGPARLAVDIWHWKDADLQTVQRARADSDRTRTWTAVVHLRTSRFVQLATPQVPTVRIAPGGEAVFAESDNAYRSRASWEGRYHDLHVADLETGRLERVVEKAKFDASMSPGGKYLVHYDAETRRWRSISTADGAITDLTGPIDARFDDETWDTPDDPRPYGVAGWLDGDEAVLLYDRYDIWEVRPDGRGARSITGGAGRRDGLVFRYLKTDPDERAIPSKAPLLASVLHEASRASGFARIPPDRAGDPDVLFMADKMVGGLLAAQDADRVVFTQQRFEEFPDLWTSNGSFRAPVKVSDANPQQARFNWGRSRLVSFANADGRPLRAILTTPEDFDPSRSYPLLVYVYEGLSHGLHRYVPPAPGTSVNITRYVSNGYIVLQPDVVYETGYPGESAVKCVLPAIQQVLAMGFVDPARIGIQGHSWGGYQVTYLVTRTNMFRAAQAGAPVANMISAYGGIRSGSGLSRAFQYERAQSRIGGPPWTKPLQFIENSPIFWVEKVNTPYLSLHNDEDDAVPWQQGIEFFTALRRLGKEAYLFNYNGEKHSLRRRENQKHWTVHLAEYFDHYLQGAPRPDWMEHGVPFLERGRRGPDRPPATDRE
jgi:dipeptidyl aminopeptidase/acylaminoacyl peptidase